MVYTVEFKPAALRQLNQLAKSSVVRIVTFIEDLAAEGDPTAAERLPDPNTDLYRVRIGSHRIIYMVAGGLVTVLAVDPYNVR